MPSAPARLRTILLLAVIAALAALAPASAFAVANPGQVELSSGALSYVARPGQQNNVSVLFTGSEIVVTDTGASITYGAGCHPGTSTHEVRCSQDDQNSSQFTWTNYSIQTGDLDDTISVSNESSQYGGPSSGGTLDGGA